MTFCHLFTRNSLLVFYVNDSLSTKLLARELQQIMCLQQMPVILVSLHHIRVCEYCK